ncbi:DEAD-box ATP-dependent RNA helicase 42-like [Nasonia vitripennis]|uniref:Uncharacterized protein n=1 Tax=Nasonia vitripennis TaxID=7425 RepID=A0A7M7H664_NASVI|nr:DEAD-box ATP-dependent RNA helicase 42-like [Nasonia vitripennis]
MARRQRPPVDSSNRMQQSAAQPWAPIPSNYDGIAQIAQPREPTPARQPGVRVAETIAAGTNRPKYNQRVKSLVESRVSSGSGSESSDSGRSRRSERRAFVVENNGVDQLTITLSIDQLKTLIEQGTTGNGIERRSHSSGSRDSRGHRRSERDRARQRKTKRDERANEREERLEAFIKDTPEVRERESRARTKRTADSEKSGKPGQVSPARPNRAIKKKKSGVSRRVDSRPAHGPRAHARIRNRSNSSPRRPAQRSPRRNVNAVEQVRSDTESEFELDSEPDDASDHGSFATLSDESSTEFSYKSESEVDIGAGYISASESDGDSVSRTPAIVFETASEWEDDYFQQRGVRRANPAKNERTRKYGSKHASSPENEIRSRGDKSLRNSDDKSSRNSPNKDKGRRSGREPIRREPPQREPSDGEKRRPPDDGSNKKRYRASDDESGSRQNRRDESPPHEPPMERVRRATAEEVDTRKNQQRESNPGNSGEAQSQEQKPKARPHCCYCDRTGHAVESNLLVKHAAQKLIANPDKKNGGGPDNKKSGGGNNDNPSSGNKRGNGKFNKKRNQNHRTKSRSDESNDRNEGNLGGDRGNEQAEDLN